MAKRGRPDRPRGGTQRRSEPPRLVFVDSGGFIGLFSADDKHHEEADALFRACIEHKTKLLTSELVVAEVHRFILFEVGIEAAAIAIDKIAASSSLTVEYGSADHHRAARAWLAKLDDQVISYTDAVSFSIMAARGCKVALSFDDDFVIAGYTPLGDLIAL